MIDTFSENIARSLAEIKKSMSILCHNVKRTHRTEYLLSIKANNRILKIKCERGRFSLISPAAIGPTSKIYASLATFNVAKRIFSESSKAVFSARRYNILCIYRAKIAAAMNKASQQ